MKMVLGKIVSKELFEERDPVQLLLNLGEI